jgi:hypothetical protein
MSTIPGEVETHITLMGSTDYVCDFMKCAIHAILHRRGGDDRHCEFHPLEKYGVPLHFSSSNNIKVIVEENAARLKEWIFCGIAEELAVTLMESKTSEVLEVWNFRVVADEAPNGKNLNLS